MFGNIHAQCNFKEDCILFPRFSSFYTFNTLHLTANIPHSALSFLFFILSTTNAVLMFGNITLYMLKNNLNKASFVILLAMGYDVTIQNKESIQLKSRISMSITGIILIYFCHVQMALLANCKMVTSTDHIRCLSLNT